MGSEELTAEGESANAGLLDSRLAYEVSEPAAIVQRITVDDDTYIVGQRAHF